MDNLRPDSLHSVCFIDCKTACFQSWIRRPALGIRNNPRQTVPRTWINEFSFKFVVKNAEVCYYFGCGIFFDYISRSEQLSVIVGGVGNARISLQQKAVQIWMTTIERLRDICIGSEFAKMVAHKS